MWSFYIHNMGLELVLNQLLHLTLAVTIGLLLNTMDMVCSLSSLKVVMKDALSFLWLK